MLKIIIVTALLLCSMGRSAFADDDSQTDMGAFGGIVQAVEHLDAWIQKYLW